MTDEFPASGLTVDSVSVPRVALRTEAPLPARLDGAWWPQSLDLEVEFADLADHFPPELGRIVHLVYSKRRWAQTAAWVKGGRARFVRTGSFLGTADAERVLLRLDTARSLSLMVVPPTVEPADAARAMDAAAAPGNTRSATDILAESTAAPAADTFRAHDPDGSAATPPTTQPRS